MTRTGHRKNSPRTANMATSGNANSLYVLGELKAENPIKNSVINRTVLATMYDEMGRDFHFMAIILGMKRTRQEKIRMGKNRPNNHAITDPPTQYTARRGSP